MHRRMCLQSTALVLLALCVHTTVAQLVETTPPPEVAPASSILLHIQNAFYTQLNSSHGQLFNALVALAFGVVLLVDGEFVFKWLVVGGVFIAATLLAHNETAAVWSLDDKSPLRCVIGVEVGLIFAYNAMRGMEGLLLLIGAALGAVVAAHAQSVLVSAGLSTLKNTAWLVVTWYSLIIFSFVAMVAKKKHVRALGVLTPLLGGALVASALSWLATTAVQHGLIRTSTTVVPGPWIDFLMLLFGFKGHADVGLFPSVPGMNRFSGSGWPGDRIIGCVLWLLFFVVGSLVQYRKQQKVRTVVVAQAMEPLLQNSADDSAA